jgi:hypothetical protein
MRMHFCCTFSTFIGNHLIHSNICCCHFYVLLTQLVTSAIIELNKSLGGIALKVFVAGNAPSASNMTLLGLANGVHGLYTRSYIIIQSFLTVLTPWRNSKDQLAGQSIQICYKITKKRPCTQSEFAKKRTLEQESC